MTKEELIKLIKSLPDDKCLVTIICGKPYMVSYASTVSVIANRATFTVTGNFLLDIHKKSHHETILYIIDRSRISIDEDSLCLNIEILKDRIDKYKYFIDVPHTPLPSDLPFMTQQKINELIELKEQEEKKQDELNELLSKLKEDFVEFKKDDGISKIMAQTTGKVDNNTEVKKSVIFPDCPRNEKWSDETILNIINFVNSGIVYDEKQYTVVSRAGVGFLGDLADYVLMGHVWDIKNKRALVLKEKHKSYCLFFKNGKYTYSLNIIPNEDIVASYKVEGVL